MRNQDQQMIRRMFVTDAPQVRQDGEDGDGTAVIEGYALKWDDSYDIFDDGSLIESFKRGAFKDTLASDKQALMVEHSGPALSSTQNESLSLKEDKTGLRFQATLDLRDPMAMGAMVRTENGTSTGVSVGFWIGDYERAETDDGDLSLTHTGVRHLFEISLVHNPAYTSSEASLKRYRSIVEEVNGEKELEAKIRQEQLDEAQNWISEMRVKSMRMAV